MITFHTFIHLLFLGLVTLFPPVNPIGSALMVNHYFAGLSIFEKRSAVLKITLYAFLICSVTLFFGHWILRLFGLSVPVIRVAGGTMICKTGWDLLSGKSDAERRASDAKGSERIDDLQGQLFFPITFPITTGAGTMSVLFTLGAHSADADFVSYALNTSALLLSVVIMCVLVYIFYMHTQSLLKYAGSSGEKIINRIFAFLTFCVGLQIATTGIKGLDL